MSRTLSGLFLVGALNRPRERKRTNRENPRTIPEQLGKIPEKSGKSQRGPKRTKKEGQVQIGKPPRLKHPRLAALEFLPRGIKMSRRALCPEGPARQIDVSRQKLSPHCLEAIFDSQLPSPKLSPQMPPKLSLPHKRGLFIHFQN